MSHLFEILSWIGALGLFGMYYFNSTGKTGHILPGHISGMIGNVLYIGVGFSSGVYAMAVMGVVFAVLNIRGIRSWWGSRSW